MFMVGRTKGSKNKRGWTVELSQMDKFYRHVNRGSDDECWEWKASRDRKGYGQFHIGKKSIRSHRVSWIVHFGEIPEGLHVLHHCDNPPCCNPHHLFLGTNRDNALDRECKGRGNKINAKNRGEGHGMSKLTNEQVLEILELLKDVNCSLREIGDKFGVSRDTIYSIKMKLRWKWINNDSN
jgi:hypothetical protein